MINIKTGTNYIHLRVENPQPAYDLRLFSDNFGKSYQIGLSVVPSCNTIDFDLEVLSSGMPSANTLVLDLEGNYRAQLIENGLVVKEFFIIYQFSSESKTTYSETQTTIIYK